MRILALAAAVALLLGGCAYNYAEPDAPVYAGGRGEVRDPDPRIRVVTYNIAFARHVEEAILGLARPPLAGADVLALQEMDVPGVEAVARALKLNYVYIPISISPQSGRDFGNAILSPWPIRDVEKLILPHEGFIGGQARGATAATVVVDGRPIRVFSTHFGAEPWTAAWQRRDQADSLMAAARGWPGPVILLGDFNSARVGKRFADSGYRWVTRDVGATANGFSIDHIFVRGLLPVGKPWAATVPGLDEPSDHLPVWADLVPR